jgi:hypothetical protein
MSSSFNNSPAQRNKRPQDPSALAEENPKKKITHSRNSIETGKIFSLNAILS